MIGSVKNASQLTRRLLANYLMFGLLSISTLAAGMLIIARASQSPSGGPGLVPRLALAAERLTRDAADNRGELMQSIIEGLSTDGEISFCGVISADGTYAAHSNAILKGRRSAINMSPEAITGVVEQVSFLRENQPGPREYWLPLRENDKLFGLLQARVRPEESMQLMQVVHQNFGTAVSIPVLLLVIGGIRLRGVIRTCSTIDEQLARLAVANNDEGIHVQTVDESTPTAAGWNRVVAKLEKGQVLKNLESRLNNVLCGVRTQRYEQILQHMSEGIAVTDSSGMVTFSNRAFALLLDTTDAALLGQPLVIAIPETVTENMSRFTAQCQELSRPAVIELHRSEELSDGVLRLARTPFQADESSSLFQLWSLRDITQLKLVEHSRDQFVDTASHELRTPLSNIRICAETLALDDELDVELQKSYLNTISAEATRLSRFVDEFLNISRMEAGSISLNRHVTQIDRLLKEALEKTRAQFDQKQIELNVHLPAKMPELNLDKDKIAAALVNLLGNAGKYTPEGGKVSLSVELGKSEIRIHIEDTGFGIGPEELGRIFNKFFRSDDQRVRDITGTGLGLTFAQEVVRLHGGQISVRSEVNKGSRFTLTLPVA